MGLTGDTGPMEVGEALMYRPAVGAGGGVHKYGG